MEDNWNSASKLKGCDMQFGVLESFKKIESSRSHGFANAQEEEARDQRSGQI